MCAKPAPSGLNGAAGQRVAASGGGQQRLLARDELLVSETHLPPACAVLGLAAAPGRHKGVLEVQAPLCALRLLLPRSPAECEQRRERRPGAKPPNGLQTGLQRAHRGGCLRPWLASLEIWYASGWHTLQPSCAAPGVPLAAAAAQRAARREMVLHEIQPMPSLT